MERVTHLSVSRAKGAPRDDILTIEPSEGSETGAGVSGTKEDQQVNKTAMSEEVEILRSRPRRGKQEASDWAAERVRKLETKAEAEGGRSNGLEVAQSSTQNLAKKDGVGSVRQFVEEVLSKRRRELPSEMAVEELISRERDCAVTPSNYWQQAKALKGWRPEQGSGLRTRENTE